jgi:hypothetical protein
LSTLEEELERKVRIVGRHGRDDFVHELEDLAAAELQLLLRHFPLHRQPPLLQSLLADRKLIRAYLSDGTSQLKCGEDERRQSVLDALFAALAEVLARQAEELEGHVRIGAHHHVHKAGHEELTDERCGE